MYTLLLPRVLSSGLLLVIAFAVRVERYEESSGYMFVDKTLLVIFCSVHLIIRRKAEVFIECFFLRKIGQIFEFRAKFFSEFLARI